jgi:hypothetical protein
MDAHERTAPREGSLRATPELERKLGLLRRKVRRGVWLHGLGTLVAVVGLWLVFAFIADWGLHVPKGVRWLHLAVLIALAAAVAWRELWSHLKRVPGRAGLAVLAERAGGNEHELLVSAVELQQSATPDGDPRLVARVLEAADRRAAEVGIEGVLERRGPRRRFAMGTALAGCIAAVSLFEPTYASIFFRRLFGGEVPWPQLTWLEVSIPNLSDKAEIKKSAELIEVRVARGTDVPVLVRADGRVPADVTLHFEAGHKLVLGSSGEGLFRALLSACQEDLGFHVTGGDDRDGRPRVRVVVLDPPDVTGLAVEIAPPAYTGLPARVEFESDVEVPAGSELRVTALCDPPDAVGRVRLLPEDRELELSPRAYPAGDPQADAAERAGRSGLSFALVASESLRYRFELEDSTGLSNPDPGLFAVHVLPDREPEVELLSPGRTEVDTVPGGALALRVRAEDDFGIGGLAWTARASNADAPAIFALEHRPEDPAFPSGSAAEMPRAVRAAARIEVAALAPADRGAASLVGEQFALDVRAVDNRPGSAAEDAGPLSWVAEEDRAGVGHSSAVRVRVLSEDEFLRRLQDRLARLRLSVSELEELQRQKHQRTRELVAGLESDDPGLGSGSGELAAALAGQRRVQGDAEAAARELAAVLESVLYARIDPKAADLLESLDARLAETPTRAFQAEAWRGFIAEWRGAEAPVPGLADQLVSLVGLALDIGSGSVAEAAAALDRAAQAIDLTGVHGELLSAERHQAAALLEIEELLGRLGEWDNFQSILTLTRDILNRQKALRDRTREHALDK